MSANGNDDKLDFSQNENYDNYVDDDSIDDNVQEFNSLNFKSIEEQKKIHQDLLIQYQAAVANRQKISSFYLECQKDHKTQNDYEILFNELNENKRKVIFLQQELENKTKAIRKVYLDLQKELQIIP